MKVFRGTARRRHLGADHVHGQLAAGLARGPLGDRAEARGPLSDHFLGRRIRIAGAGHRTIEVNLAKARLCVLADHVAGLPHGQVSRLGTPGVGTEVIAADPELRRREG